MVDLSQVLELFLKSEDFALGVLASTRAGFEGNDYKVELLPDGHWSVKWSRMIGNGYISPGCFMTIPSISDDAWDGFVAMAGGDEDNAALLPYLIGSDELESIAQDMRASFGGVVE